MSKEKILENIRTAVKGLPEAKVLIYCRPADVLIFADAREDYFAETGRLVTIIEREDITPGFFYVSTFPLSVR